MVKHGLENDLWSSLSFLIHLYVHHVCMYVCMYVCMFVYTVCKGPATKKSPIRFKILGFMEVYRLWKIYERSLTFWLIIRKIYVDDMQLDAICMKSRDCWISCDLKNTRFYNKFTGQLYFKI